jgi:GT2 family glycosyltransferase
MVKQMDYPENAICGMKLIFPEVTDLPSNNLTRPPGKIQHIGLTSNIRGEMVHVFLGWSPDNPKVNRMHDVYAVTGAAMLIRRSLFIKAGKFYEGYGHGTYEDVDLCLTIREMGYNVVVEPKAEGYHYTGATSMKYNIGFPIQYNQIIFMQRWASKLDWCEVDCL